MCKEARKDLHGRSMDLEVASGAGEHRKRASEKSNSSGVELRRAL